MRPTRFYSCYDFRLRSELALPELTPARADDAAPVVEVRFGPVPARLPGARIAGSLQARGGEALLTVEHVGRFLMRDGVEIVVDPLEDAPARNLRLFLLGSALGIICHQRGLLPLHANAVAVDGGAVAFCGPSGVGKSTLAAHFARAGYPVLCDDVCAVSFDAAERPLAWPGLPRLKLWSDAAVAFGHDPAALERAVEGVEKFHVPLPATGAPGPLPLRRVYLLASPDPGATGGVSRLSGHRAMAALMAQTYRDGYVPAMGFAERNFRQCAALLAAVEVYEARRAWGLDVFEREARRLECHMRAQMSARPGPVVADCNPKRAPVAVPQG